MSKKIECVIQEIQYDEAENLTGLKITGSEGYLLKQGNKEYNVFCPKEMPQIDATASMSAEILCAETPLKLNPALKAPLSQILVQAKCANKKVRLEICGNSGTIRESIDPNKINIRSIAIL